MSSYAKCLSHLIRTIIDGEKDDQKEELSGLIKASPLATPLERMSIYGDGYVTRMISACLDDYPALLHFWGENKLKAALYAFVRETPSQHWDLNLYAQGFAGFLAENSQDTKAVALARLEGAIRAVFWAPDSAELEPDQLKTLSEEEFGEVRFCLRTASKLLMLDHAANAYVSAFRDGAPLSDLSESGEYVLIIRTDNTVKRYQLEPIEYEILSQFDGTTAFDEVLSHITDQEALEAKLALYLSRWLEGAFLQSLKDRR